MTFSAVLLDVEGTTSPISFVREILFPYAKNTIERYVTDNFARLEPEISRLANEHSADKTYERGLEKLSPKSVSAYLKFLIDADRKSTPLKSIQGLIWQAGYESGELRSPVFEDVPPALSRWTDAGKSVSIYSSGSVLAQQLLFRFTECGDLTRFIFKYFDTNIGAKRDAASYQAIAAELQCSPNLVLFVSDVVEELRAADSAQFQTALCIRDGNERVSEDAGFTRISSFDELG